jgi:OPA family glycerol-3-phosphate transporter-like MFS transporter 3
MFGVVSEWFNIYNQVWYISFWIINGFAQSTGWPGVVAVMGNWFGKSGYLIRQTCYKEFFLESFIFSRRGLIFGIWSANASVGNIFGALMAASVLKYGYHVNI